MHEFGKKLMSGRFLFTVVTAVVFGWMSITGKLPADKVSEVILLVIYAYFNRARSTEVTK